MKRICSRYALGTKPADTPIDNSLKLEPNERELLLDQSKYRRIVGTLIHITATRPDLSFAASMASQFIHHVSYD